MSLNNTPKGERLHIGIFGRRNAGKSSIINAITDQNIAIVSDVKGTTTDPVYKAMELLPIGPVMIIDTPGIDDEGELGSERVKASYRVLNKCDVALLVVDARDGFTDGDIALLDKIKEKKIPYTIAFNKCDVAKGNEEGVIYCSAKEGINIDLLKGAIIKTASIEKPDKKIVGDLINEGDTVLLVVPIDSAAPKGRLILPQQQTVRDILDSDCVAVVVKEDKVKEAVRKYSPNLVVCDSQIFGKVKNDVPQCVPLTSFSILFARYKGDLEANLEGVEKLDNLTDGDVVLVSEGCTHHRQCGDIGTIKMPMWIKKHTGRDLTFEFTHGGEFPENLTKYALVVHCGGCMLNEKEMKYRIALSRDAGVPIVNYGMAIAHMNGILERSLEPLNTKKVTE
ncbi:MAG: [Clostridia bacterium]|nr:[FeFe] hydrogenase H-cluster maturation GTPase HydF [Clostridia bacterium]